MEIKGYTILEEISRGPVTTVFRATQDALERTVLLKVLNIQWNQDSEFLERFRREARISAKLNHQNIASIFDFGMDGEYFYIAMEFITGRTLKELAEKAQPLPFSVILNLTKQICDGLIFAHGKGIVHRDIKPTNILVGHDGIVKITDFGLATVADLPSITEQGIGVGTPAYMSPEQALGKKASFQSDLFSLGATLYELCTGSSPFRADTLAETITNVTRNTPPPVSEINPEIPRRYGDLLTQLLEKDPARRPADLVSLQSRLDSLMSGSDQADLEKYVPNPKRTLSFKESSNYPEKKSNPIKWTVVFALLLLMTFIFYYGISGNMWVTAESVESIIETDSLGTEKPTAAYKAGSAPDSSGGLTLERIIKSPVRRPVADKQIMSTDTTVAQVVSNSVESLLYIVCVPWADIYIDDKYIDTTPIDYPVPLGAGKHVIEFRNPNYQTFRHPVEVSTTAIETLNVSLESKDGFLMVQAVPWADIYVNDTYRETTPLKEPIVLAAGKHVLRLTNPGYAAIIDTVLIRPGEQIDKKFKF